jgi:hypothetical protein
MCEIQALAKKLACAFSACILDRGCTGGQVGWYTADHIVLGLDIKGYSQREVRRQKFAQDVLDRCLVRAIDQAKWSGKPAGWIDGGDGGYVLLEGSEKEALDIVQHFYQQLAYENDNTNPQDKIYVRAALNVDQVVRWSTSLGAKYTGHAINNCARLLSGMSKVHHGQVVCSDAFRLKLNTIVKDVEIERLHDIEDKHGNLHKVFNLYRIPHFGVQADPTERNPNPLVWP